MEQRFQVGDRLTIIYPQYGGKEIIYPIKEVRTYPMSKSVLYFYETAPGHRWSVLDNQISDDRRVSHDKTGWAR